MVQAFDIEGHSLGPAMTLAPDSLGGPLLTAGETGFVLGYEVAKPRIFRTQALSLAGRPQGAALDWPSDGSVMTLLALRNGPELICADSGYRGDDPSDQMGLYHLQRPDQAPVALTPLDRSTARFGTAARSDAGLAWAWTEGETLRASIGQKSVIISRTADGTPVVTRVGAHLALSWSDHRDDRSTACTVLKECVNEGYIALYRADGRELVPPTRATRVARAHPAAPYDDWERLCAR